MNLPLTREGRAADSTTPVDDAVCFSEVTQSLLRLRDALSLSRPPHSSTNTVSQNSPSPTKKKYIPSSNTPTPPPRRLNASTSSTNGSSPSGKAKEKNADQLFEPLKKENRLLVVNEDEAQVLDLYTQLVHKVNSQQRSLDAMRSTVNNGMEANRVSLFGCEVGHRHELVESEGTARGCMEFAQHLLLVQQRCEEDGKKKVDEISIWNTNNHLHNVIQQDVVRRANEEIARLLQKQFSQDEACMELQRHGRVLQSQVQGLERDLHQARHTAQDEIRQSLAEVNAMAKKHKAIVAEYDSRLKELEARQCTSNPFTKKKKVLLSHSNNNNDSGSSSSNEKDKEARCAQEREISMLRRQLVEKDHAKVVVEGHSRRLEEELESAAQEREGLHLQLCQRSDLEVGELQRLRVEVQLLGSQRASWEEERRTLSRRIGFLEANLPRTTPQPWMMNPPSSPFSSSMNNNLRSDSRNNTNSSDAAAAAVVVARSLLFEKPPIMSNHRVVVSTTSFVEELAGRGYSCDEHAQDVSTVASEGSNTSEAKGNFGFM